jgi:FkbM family methyltransferase
MSQTTQSRIPGSSAVSTARAVWIDVGAHRGQKTYEHARNDPALTVFAFEPNLRRAAELAATLDNYIVIPMAVCEREGFGLFHLNRFDAASSLLPLDTAALAQWIGGEQLSVETDVLVPTIRLDTFLDRMGIAKVDYLKIDAQGGDFGVIQSLGDRISDVEKIVLEIAVTPLQLYVGGAEKAVVVSYLEDRGFELVDTRAQSHGQEENLTFVRNAAHRAATDRRLPAAGVGKRLHP